MQALAAVMTREQEAGTASSEMASSEMVRILSGGLPSLYRGAYKLLQNREDAEDAVQDALLAAYKHLDQFRGDAQISTWVMTIVLNCARMQLRRRSHSRHVSLESRIVEDQEFSFSDILVDHRPTPEEECHRSKMRARLTRSIAQLSPRLRKTFQLRYVDQLSIYDTARVLGVPIGTVKAQTARARAKLRKLLRGVAEPRSRSCSGRG
jgi:RNA polymerase sigma-70 factor, ECF subfamily